MKSHNTPQPPVLSSAYQPEIIEIDPSCDSVRCDGGGGALGHPAVFYTLTDKDFVDCLYCDRRFVKRTSAYRNS